MITDLILLENPEKISDFDYRNEHLTVKHFKQENGYINYVKQFYFQVVDPYASRIHNYSLELNKELRTLFRANKN